MPKRPSGSRGGKKKQLYPWVGLFFLGLLVFSFYVGRSTVPRKPPVEKKTQTPRTVAQVHPVPAPVPSPKPLPKPAAPAAPKPLPPVAEPSGPVFPHGRGKIAIVLDDWGYTLNQMPKLESIRQPVTVAVLPGLPHSEEVAQGAEAVGHEVILHMPMEALDENAPREGETLLTGMSRTKVLELLSHSLSTVPTARGISNHQGSKATSNAALMATVLQETKRRGLYFLDSYVTNRSICEEAARKIKVPFARRAIFLDNEQTTAGIQRQLVSLAQAASQKGQAIGIGHDRPVMLSVLQKAAPALEKAGYTLVPVSDLTEVPHPRSRN